MSFHELQGKWAFAADRCRRMSESEWLLGYTESAQSYREMAVELRSLFTWLNRERLQMELAATRKARTG